MKNKYNARKIEYNGVIFHSKKECLRFKELLALEKSGEIQNLQMQVKYVLIPAQRDKETVNSKGKTVKGKVLERECAYIADFVYEKDGETVVEDVKGFRRSQAYSLFVIKRKLMLERYGISVQEI